MAENTSTISGDVPLETGDDLSEEQLRKYIAREAETDYVERGCGFSVDHGADTIDIGNTNTRGNYAILSDSNLAYPVFPDQATGLSLPDAAGTNHVYIQYDTSADEINYVINDTGSTPTQPALKIGEVDTSADTSTETNRADPAGLSTVTVSSDYTTNGEDIIYVDESSGAVTVTLASADATLANRIRVVNVSGANTVTIDTEASETIDPGAESSKTIDTGGWHIDFVSDGTNWDADSAAEYESVTTDQLVIGGTIFEEDDNSPIDVSGTSSTTYTVAGTFDHIIIIPQRDNRGFSGLRVNGDTGNNYDHVDNSDTQTTGDGEWPISTMEQVSMIEIFDRGSANRMGYRLDQMFSGTGRSVGGQNTTISGNISQFTLRDGSNQTAKARVFGRSMGV